MELHSQCNDCSHCRVAAEREKNLEIEFFFLVSEKSGNFGLCQRNLENKKDKNLEF